MAEERKEMHWKCMCAMSRKYRDKKEDLSNAEAAVVAGLQLADLAADFFLGEKER